MRSKLEFRIWNLEFWAKILFFVFIILYSIFHIPNSVKASFVSNSSSNFTNTLKTGLVGWWTFDGANMKNNVTDSSGQNNNGNMVGWTSTSSAIVAGKLGQGLRFDGVNDVVTGPTYNGVKTVSFWLKPNSTTQQILMLDANLASTSVSSGTISANNFTSPTIYVDGAVSSTISNTNWHFITITTATTINASAIKIGQTGTGYYKGLLDDVRVYNRVLSASEVKQLYSMGADTKMNITPTAWPSPLKQGLTLWWTLDGADTKWNTQKENDKSGTGSAGSVGTLAGFSTSTSVLPGKMGQALSFNGASNVYSTNAISAFMSNATGTMSLWFYPKNGNSGTCSDGSMSALISDYDGVSLGGYAWLGYDGANLCAGGYDGVLRVISSAVSKNKWTHAVWVHKNGVLTLWKDGALVSAQTLGNISDISRPMYLGRSYLNTYFNGYLDDVRMYSTALSTSTIQTLYNAGASTKVNVSLSPPQSLGQTNLMTGLVGWWTFDGKDTNWATGVTNDKSGNSNNGQLINMSTSTSVVRGKLGQGLKFDGISGASSGTYVNVGSPTTLTNLSALTVSVWAKTNGYGVSGQGVLVSKKSWYGAGDGWLFSVNSSYHDIDFFRKYDGGTSLDVLSTANTLTTSDFGKWIHWTVTTDGTANASGVHIYKNGVDVTGTTVTNGVGNRYSDAAINLELGNVLYNQTFNGVLDDIRVYNRVLSVTEIKQLYNMGK